MPFSAAMETFTKGFLLPTSLLGNQWQESEGSASSQVVTVTKITGQSSAADIYWIINCTNNTLHRGVAASKIK